MGMGLPESLRPCVASGLISILVFCEWLDAVTLGVMVGTNPRDQAKIVLSRTEARSLGRISYCGYSLISGCSISTLCDALLSVEQEGGIIRE